MNIALWLNRAGLSHPGMPAVGQGARVALDYGALAARAARLAGVLRGFGLAPGDRVAIASKNCVEYVEMMFGIWHAGLAAVPANAKLHGRELGYILEHSGARVCLASAGLDEELRRFDERLETGKAKAGELQVFMSSIVRSRLLLLGELRVQ